MQMPFGKHRGRPLAEIDIDYLVWLRDNTDIVVTKPTLYAAVLDELWRRTRFRKAKPQARPQPLAVDFKSLLATWRREAAKRWHPDHGGDTRVMAAINVEYQQLVELFEKGLAA